MNLSSLAEKALRDFEAGETEEGGFAMSIEDQIIDIEARLVNLENLLEAAIQRKPMTMSAAMELSTGNKARTMPGYPTEQMIFVVKDMRVGFEAKCIEDGIVTDTCYTERQDQLEDYFYTRVISPQVDTMTSRERTTKRGSVRN
jgi:hypothetical protein